MSWVSSVSPRGLSSPLFTPGLRWDRPAGRLSSGIHRICREAGATWLEGKIVTQVTRRVIRALPAHWIEGR